MLYYPAVRSPGKVFLGILVALVGLGPALAWRITTWGRPLPVAYRRVAVTPAQPGSGRSFAYLQAGTGHRTIAADTDGDGTVDTVLAEGGEISSFVRPPPDDPEARWLILCLDGVPYEEMLALWEEGYFREFFRPVPLISPFPSDSESALTDAFHAGPVPGYEHRYFDRGRNRLAGGALTTLTGQHVPYLAVLDYDMPGYLKGLAYVLPEKSYRADLGRLRRRFLASGEKVFLAHLASSDSLYHIRSAADMRRLLVEADSLLRELYLDAGGKLRLTVFSDHGNSLEPSRPLPLREFLGSRGWQLRDRLEGSKDIVVPAYGLVGFLAVYWGPRFLRLPPLHGELARDLTQLEGVDLVVYGGASEVTIESARGPARLSWNQDATAFRYQPRGGDPLELAGVLATLKQEGKMDAAGWVKDVDLLAATADHRYPDPGYRLWQWATNHVRNRADLLVSLKPGTFYGSGSFQGIVDLASTHGALDRGQSLGFAMSTDGPLPSPLRSRDLLPKDLTLLKGTGKRGAN